MFIVNFMAAAFILFMMDADEPGWLTVASWVLIVGNVLAGFLGLLFAVVPAAS